MSAKSKSRKVTDDLLFTMYMNYVLEHEIVPKSVYKFCKLNAITETEFYGLFGSLETLQKEIWNKFYANTHSLLMKNKDFENFSRKEKMLTFFFTFFEMLTLNRSYVLFTLKQENDPLKNLNQLKGLRRHLKSFTKDLIDAGNSGKVLKITQHNPNVFSEGAWLQFLFLLKFWINDQSAGFEKTDIAIEKSVNTIFDVFDNTPLEHIIDFGKFLYKETFV